MIKLIPTALLCAVISMCVVTTVKAQTPAYVIKGTDTTKGVVQYKKWSQSPLQIKFKALNGQQFETILPQDVTEFGVYTVGETERYRSFKLQIDRSATNPASYKESAEPELSEAKWVFALVLVDGNTQLYNYSDDLKAHYLIKKGNNDLAELTSKEYYNADNHHVIRNDSYKQQLQALTADCAAINRNTLSQLLYSESSLSKFVDMYNICTGGSKGSTFVKEKVRYELTVLGGASFTNFSLLTTNGKLPYANFKSKAQPAFGFGITLLPSRSRINYFAELLYRQYDVTGTHSETTPNGSDDNTFQYDNKNVKLNIGLKYLLTNGDVKTYIFLGAANGFAIKKAASVTKRHRFLTTDQTTVEQDTDLPGYEFGGFGGVGVSYNHFGIQGRYETTLPFDTFNNFSAKANTAYIMLTYSL